MANVKKAAAIKDCLSNAEVDLWRLREYALTEGGFLSRKLLPNGNFASLGKIPNGEGLTIFKMFEFWP